MAAPAPLLTEKHGSLFVAVMSSDLETLEGSKVKQAEESLLQVLEDESCQQLLIDMSTVRFFGSAFIESLIRIWNKLKHRPASSLGFIGLQSYCVEVLAITHLDQIWKIYPSLEAALEARKTNS